MRNGVAYELSSKNLKMLILLLLLARSQAQQLVCPVSDADAKWCSGGGHSIAPDNFTTASATECCQLCKEHSNCVGWVAYNASKAGRVTCHIKESATSAICPQRTPQCDKWCGSLPPPPTPAPNPPPKGAKNVLFVVSDDFRPSSGAYGVKEASTPNLDRLAAEGILFTAAHVQFSYCAPSRNSFM